MIARSKKQSWRLAKKLHPMSKKKMRGGRMIVEVFNADNTLAQRTVGPTTAALLKEHAYGHCWAFCSFCVFEAEQYLKKNKSIV